LLFALLGYLWAILQSAQLSLKPEIKGSAALVVWLIVASWYNDVELGEIEPAARLPARAAGAGYRTTTGAGMVKARCQ
jgi:hypothetical protein